MNNLKKGFTIPEFNIALAITMTVFVAAISLYVSVWRGLTIGGTYLDTYAGSRNASGHLIQDIRCAAQVVDQYPETGTATYETGDHVIVLKVPSINVDTKRILSTYYDYIIYKLVYNSTNKSNDLYRIVHISQKFNTVGDPYYHKSYRIDSESRIVANYCTSLTFRSGAYGLQHYVDNGTLSTINTVAIYLPINKTNITIGGTGQDKINPTTIVRLRNK